MQRRPSSSAVFLLSLLACGKSSSGSASAGSAQAACTAAIEHWEAIQYEGQTENLEMMAKSEDKDHAAMATRALAALAANRTKLKAVQAAQCVKDRWPPELLTCLTTVQAKAAGKCEQMFTPAHVAGLEAAIKAAGIDLSGGGGESAAVGAPPPAPATPPTAPPVDEAAAGEATCDDVAAASLRLLTADGGPAGGAVANIAEVMGKQCAAHGWSVEFRRCVRDAKAPDAMATCGAMLTPEQTAAMDEAIKALAN